MQYLVSQYLHLMKFKHSLFALPACRRSSLLVSQCMKSMQQILTRV